MLTIVSGLCFLLTFCLFPQEEMTCLLLCNGLSQWGDVTALVARLLEVAQPFEADLVALSKRMWAFV